MYKFCPNCGKPLSGQYRFCPSCGFSLSPAQNKSKTNVKNKDVDDEISQLINLNTSNKNDIEIDEAIIKKSPKKQKVIESQTIDVSKPTSTNKTKNDNNLYGIPPKEEAVKVLTLDLIDSLTKKSVQHARDYIEQLENLRADYLIDKEFNYFKGIIDYKFSTYTSLDINGKTVTIKEDDQEDYRKKAISEFEKAVKESILDGYIYLADVYKNWAKFLRAKANNIHVSAYDAYIWRRNADTYEKEAESWYKKLFEISSSGVKNDDPEKLFYLSKCYLYGYGVEANGAVSFYYKRKAAELGNIMAIEALAKAYKYTCTIDGKKYSIDNMKKSKYWSDKFESLKDGK